MLYPDYDYVLASGSPRRKQLLTGLGLPFRVEKREVEENYPADLPATEVAAYLAEKKAAAFGERLEGLPAGSLRITADTTVIDPTDSSPLGKLLEKPADAAEATQMLRKLSGRKHHVISAVALTTARQQVVFSETTVVVFWPLSDDEIAHYIATCSPWDKAGAYGIQEWIGLVAIRRMEGSYTNVVGMPVDQLYRTLREAF